MALAGTAYGCEFAQMTDTQITPNVTSLHTGAPNPGPGLAEPPHNFEAEQALLGAILINNEAYSRVSDFLTPEHFFDPVNGRIF
ncbi:MAG: hypothetical protein ACI82H_001282, partial [Alphaproteobacteria bacterium]